MAKIENHNTRCKEDAGQLGTAVHIWQDADWHSPCGKQASKSADKSPIQ